MGRITRRSFLRGSAGLGALGIMSAVDWHEALADAGSGPISMAMHVHASFSEGVGSMRWQLNEAAANGVDVVWWSEHDWRMSGHGYRQQVHFSGQTESEDGSPLAWTQSKSGSLSSYSGRIVTSPASPLDPAGPSSLRLEAIGSKSSLATVRWIAGDSGARLNLHGTLAGQTLRLEVFPESIGSNAYLEMRIRTSQMPSVAGRAAERYELCYRVGGPDPAGTVRATGVSGLVVLDAPVGTWTSLAVTPCDDIARLWPDLQPLDAALVELSLAAGSKSRARAAGYFDYLRFDRTLTGDQPLEVQRQLMEAYAGLYTATQLAGLEVSLDAHHLNWFGGALSLPDYGSLPIQPATNNPAATAALVTTIHDRGGLASYNHMFGSSNSLGTSTAQEKKRRQVAADLISRRAFGADVLEVGYRQRGGVDLSRHLAVWDACSRNAIFLTGNGVNDSHGGSWATQMNRFLTWAWAADATEESLLGALGAGRCTFGDPRFTGQLDLVVDGVCPMGSVSISDLPVRLLGIVGSGFPAGGSVRVIQGPVDLGGPASPDPGTAVVMTIPSSAFEAGFVEVVLDTTVPTFARVEVLDDGGQLFAGSNPVWLLRSDPPGGIPPARAG